MVLSTINMSDISNVIIQTNNVSVPVHVPFSSKYFT